MTKGLRTSIVRWTVIGVMAAVAVGCATGSAAKKREQAAQRGEWDLAVGYYREAITKDPKRVEYKIALERATREASTQHVARARELEAQDQLAAAAAEYRLAIEFDPSNALAVSRALEVERRIRDRVEAARPQSRMDQMRAQAAQTSPIPKLDPRTPLPTLRFTSTSVRDVLNTIGLSTGISVQYNQGMDNILQRPFTVDLAGHSLESAFNMVLGQNQLTFKIIDSRTIFIYQDSQTERQKYEDLYQQTFYLSHADSNEVQQILNQLLTSTTGGNRPVVTQYKQANTIVVRASAPMLAMIKNIIDTADKPRAEVLIDVTILEVSRSRLKDFGIDLSQYAIGLTFSPTSAPTVVPPLVPPPIQGSSFNNPNSSQVYAAVPSVIIKFLEQDQKTRLLAKPQLRGREGQPLTMNLGDDIPVPTTTFQPIATGGPTTVPQVAYQYRPVGVNLQITTKVTYQDEIILEPIIVQKNALGPNIDVAGSSLPTFLQRTAQVSMRLRDGESNLLAGLIQEIDRDTARGLPGIPQIPFLRSIFGNTNNQVEQTDVVMIVTPHIIRSRDITTEDLKPFYVGTANNLGAGTVASLTPPGAPPPPPIPAPGTTTGPVTGAGTAGRGAGAPPATGNPPATGSATTTGAATTTPPPTDPPVTGANPPATQPRAVAIEPASSMGEAAGAPQFVLGLPTTDLQAGGPPYTMAVSASNVSQMGAVTLTINYDPKVLKATSVASGTFMSQGGVTPTFVPRIDETAGRIDIAVTRGGNAAGVAGAGTIAGIMFQAIAPGSAKVTLTGTAMNPAGQPLTVKMPAAATVVVK